ncbi:TrmB family transcriptional regulator [Candidatus Pacearchaeota archaeon]|nr:TrmB family transcriptional regulator [Candidatus Pacearchaeota archaeon]
MLIEQDLIKKVRDYFDLNIYETKVWLALLKKGVASAGEISSMSGVPRSRAYDVLEGLEKRGFVIVKLEKPVKYIGVKPRIVLEKLKNNIKKTADEKMVEISNIRETNEFENLENLYNEGLQPVKSEEKSVALRGKSNITNHLKEIISDAKSEIIICMNAEELLSKSRIFNQTFSNLKKSGVKIKVALSGNDAIISQEEKKFKMNFKRTKVKAKFFIIDRKEILFYLTNKTEDETAIWLNSEFFAQAFALLFEKAIGGMK